MTVRACPRPNWRRRGARGLTLIEVGIALAVLAILAAVAMPALSARLERQRLNSSAQLLAGDLVEGRFEAARRGRTLYLQTEAGPAWCWSISATPGCPCGDAQACQIRNVRAAEHPGVLLTVGHAVELEAGGGARGPDVATFETRRGDRLRVEVSPMGRPRVCAAAGPWPQLQKC